MMTEVRRGYQMPRNWSYSGNNPLHMSARNQILALWKTVKYSYPPSTRFNNLRIHVLLAEHDYLLCSDCLLCGVEA